MKVKTRTESAVVSAAWHRIYVSTGQVVPGSDGSGFWSGIMTKDETIKYGQGFERYNPCTHKGVRRETIAGTKTYRGKLTPDDQFDISDSPRPQDDLSHSALLEYLISQVGWSFVEWSNFYQRAIEAMTPTMETGFSLGNFLYELREVKDLITGWGLYRKRLIDALSDVSLNWNFGLRPFIRDLLSIARACFNVRDKLLDLKSGAGSLQVRHYSETVDSRQLSREWTLQTAGMSIDNREEWWVAQIRRTASMTYTYQMPDIDEDLLKLYSYLDAVGLNLNPAIVWEAIPYSFVVDWFINVGDFLAQLRKKWIPISIYIKDFGVSERFDYHYNRDNRFGGKVWSDWVRASETVGKYYKRRPVKVDDRCFTFSSGSGLDLRKFYLGALLIRQRL